MRRILLVLTTTNEPLNDMVTGLERQRAGMEVVVADLTTPAPDYQRLLEEVFSADSVQVW